MTIQIRQKEVHALEQGMRDGVLFSIIKGGSITEDVLNKSYQYIKKYEQKAYQSGFELGASGNYQEAFKTGKMLIQQAIDNGDIVANGWEIYRNRYGITSIEEIK